MDTRYVKLLFILLLFLTLLNIPFPENTKTTVASDSLQSFSENDESEIRNNSISNYSKDTFIYDIPTLSVKEKNSYAKKFHNSYESAIKALLELRTQGYINGDEILAIHKHMSNFAIDSSLEIPHGDKDLIDYLYDNNLITESQYNKLLYLMEK